jgi:hypothetical protein
MVASSLGWWDSAFRRASNSTKYQSLRIGILALVGGEGGEDFLRLRLEVQPGEVRPLAGMIRSTSPCRAVGGFLRGEGLPHDQIAVLAVERDFPRTDVLEMLDPETGGHRLVELGRVHIGARIKLRGGRSRRVCSWGR